jgi:hypothetical protein
MPYSEAARTALGASIELKSTMSNAPGEDKHARDAEAFDTSLDPRGVPNAKALRT